MQLLAPVYPSQSPVQPGDILAGRYRVERIIGQGGMGVVVAATHVTLGQRVALKFLLGEATLNGTLVERFLREGRTMVQLRSEHVARVSDVGTLESGAPYLVMEFLEGQDLSQLIEQRGPIPVKEAVDYVLQACEAVAEAHSLQIVHRDLKPGNLFLTQRRDGSHLVKVLDFGISKLQDASGSKLTQTTQVMGSPAYMSPEQVQSARGVDARSDIWALGVILYELLTGTVPFEAETLPGMFAAIVTKAPRPLVERLPEVDPGLASALEQALVKDPAARYQSVAEFAQALLPFAPASGRVTVERISRLLGAPAPLPSVLPQPNRPVAAVTGARTASTTSGQSLSHSSAAPSRVASLVVLGAALAFLVVGLVVYKLLDSSSPPLPEAAIPASEPSRPASEPPPEPKPEPPAEVVSMPPESPSQAEAPSSEESNVKPTQLAPKAKATSATTPSAAAEQPKPRHAPTTAVRPKAPSPAAPGFDPLSDGR